MNENEQNKSGPESLFADWMKTATAFWGPMVSMWTRTAEADSVTTEEKDEKKSRMQKTLESAQKTGKA